ncbi:MAG: OmpA family protein [Spirochaetia bacterium]|nr:OmpA family protein [Spirochaetia bacterium]
MKEKPLTVQSKDNIEENYPDIVIEQSLDLEENQIYKTKPIKTDDDFEVEIITENYDTVLSNDDIYKDFQKVEEKICGTENLTNHADGIDYTVSVTSGIITGLIDVFFIGEWDFKGAKAKANININNMIMKFAKKHGFDETQCKSSDKLGEAIRFLEKKFPLPGDNDFHKVKDAFGNEVITAKTHHLDDFCHHPTFIGLLCCIIVQFTGEARYSDKTGTMSKVPVTVNEYGNFVGNNTPSKIFSGVINWFITTAKTINNRKGHLISDMGGSSSSKQGGAGIPGPIMSTMKEIAALPCFKDTNFNENLRKAYQNGIGSGKNQINLGIFNSLFEGASSKMDYRTELAVKYELERQASPVMINEFIVRGFYFIRRFIEQMQDGRSIEKLDWEELLPYRNRTIIRMLTISKGVFTAIDFTDAAIRSVKGITPTGLPVIDWRKFILRINLVGTVSFVITAGIDIAMGIKKYSREKAMESSINLKLIRMYKYHAGGLSNLYRSVPKLSEVNGPLLLHFDEPKYQQTEFKIMFIGIQNRIPHTYIEYRQQKDGILNLFDECKKFNFPKKDPFGLFAKKLTADLNHHSEKKFLWNSLFKFADYHSNVIESENTNFNLLLQEIEICKPNAVIFMTGKKYDKCIKAKLGETISFEPICSKRNNKKLPRIGKKSFAKIKTTNEKLPAHIYRIRNPKSITFKLIKKRATYKWLIFLLKGNPAILTENQKEKKKSRSIVYALLILLLILIALGSFIFTKLSFNNEDIIIQEPLMQEIILDEQKSAEFKADRRDFVNYEAAMDWLDKIADLIKEKRQKNPNLLFTINGYVAVFDNEIDEKILANERAENVKNELIKRGIPKEILITNAVGKTTRWGDERRNNRAVTVESIDPTR